MWPYEAKQLSHTALGLVLMGLHTMPLMETVSLIIKPVHAAIPLNKPTPGGEWTCWSPTSSPLSPSPTEETAVQKGSTEQRFTSATHYKRMVSQTHCECILIPTNVVCVKKVIDRGTISYSSLHLTFNLSPVSSDTADLFL